MTAQTGEGSHVERYSAGLTWIEWDKQKEANIPQDSKHGLIEIKVIRSCGIRKESKRTCLE